MLQMKVAGNPIWRHPFEVGMMTQCIVLISEAEEVWLLEGR
jgi:hypothetical protein